MRRFLVGLLATIGALVLLLVVGVAAAAWLFLPRDAPELPERVVLTVDLREGLPEIVSADPLMVLGLEREPTFTEVILALDRAVDDARVRGVVARLDGEGPGFAQAQELRDAIAKLRQAGKFALAHADTFGEFGPGTQGYFLASAFDEIHLQPMGSIGLTGLLVETPLLRGLLDKIGVQPELESRGRYKTTPEIFTERELTPAARETLESLADSLYDQITDGIGQGRGLEAAEVAALIDRGPYASADAAEVGLVDGLSYWDELADEATTRAGSGSERVPLLRYLAALEAPPEDAPVVALVHGVGQVRRGNSEYGPARGWLMGGDTVAGALRDAIEDPSVRAILFRIESPGGSPVASETIGREVRRAIEAGKPVIVSMGEVAASGGYWIAMDASSIVASPATLTGSIGVFAGKPVLAELYDELGVNWGRVARGANAEMWSTGLAFDPDERARLETFLDRVYEAFVEGVARGRGLSEAQAEDAAQGRVWTGEQALEVGLVDDLGGFVRAVNLAKEAAGVAPDEMVQLRRFPPDRPPWERLLQVVRQPILALAALQDWLHVLRTGALSAPALVIR